MYHVTTQTRRWLGLGAPQRVVSIVRCDPRPALLADGWVDFGSYFLFPNPNDPLADSGTTIEVVSLESKVSETYNPPKPF